MVWDRNAGKIVAGRLLKATVLPVPGNVLVRLEHVALPTKVIVGTQIGVAPEYARVVATDLLQAADDAERLALGPN